MGLCTVCEEKLDNQNRALLLLLEVDSKIFIQHLTMFVMRDSALSMVIVLSTRLTTYSEKQLCQTLLHLLEH